MKRATVQRMTAAALLIALVAPHGAVLAQKNGTNRHKPKAVQDAISRARNANVSSTTESEESAEDTSNTNTSGLTQAEIRERIKEQQDIFQRRQEMEERRDRQEEIEDAIENGETIPSRVEEQPDGSFAIVVPDEALDTADEEEEQVETPEKRKKRIQDRRKRFKRPEFTTLDDDASLEDTAGQISTFFEGSSQNLEDFKRLSDEKRDSLKKVMETTSDELDVLVSELKSTNDPERKEELRGEIRAFLEERQEERKKVIEESVTIPDPPSLEPATELTERMEKLRDTLEGLGVNTDGLSTSLSEFQSAVSHASELSDALEDEPSIESAQALRDQLKQIKALRDEMRNQLESLVSEIKAKT